MVSEQRPGRDVKVLDDELRLQIRQLCTPCGTDWVDDRATIESLYPISGPANLGDAKTAVCLGVVMGDGTTAWGDARPKRCR